MQTQRSKFLSDNFFVKDISCVFGTFIQPSVPAHGMGNSLFLVRLGLLCFTSNKPLYNGTNLYMHNAYITVTKSIDIFGHCSKNPFDFSLLFGIYNMSAFCCFLFSDKIMFLWPIITIYLCLG